MRRRPVEHEDDELDDLPPIDGALGDDPDKPSELHEIDDPEAADGAGAASLDDTTGEDEAPDLSELEGDESESGWVDESADSPELDLGDSMLVDPGDENVSLEDGDEAPAPDEDFGVGEGGERSTLDAAEEGPIGADEELREGDLPALDADDGDDAKEKDEEDGLLDERVAGEESVGVPWAAQPWARVGPPLGLAWIGLTRGITALACVARGALVAGRAESGSFELVRVDLEGARHTLAAEGLEGARITALAAAGDSVAAVLDDGRLAISRDGGERFEIVALSEGVAAADVALAGSVFWARTRTGGLLVARTDAIGKRILERCAVPGAVVAICRDAARDARAEDLDADARAPGDASVIALAVDDAGRPATLVRGREDGTVACEAVQVSGGRPVGAIAARRDHVAYLATSARGGVFIRQPDGQWKRLVWDGRVTALTMVDDAGTLVATTYSEADDSTGLVRVDALGVASVVAKLGAARDDADADGRAIAVAFDDPRGVLWLAGGFGVAAFAVR